MEFQHSRRGDVVQPVDDAPASGCPVTPVNRRNDGDAVTLHPGVHVGRGRRGGPVVASPVALHARRGRGRGRGRAAVGRAARVRRGRRHRALAAQVPVGPRAAAQAAQPPEPVPELGRHEVVQDGIERRVYVQHDAAEEQQQVKVLDAQQLHDVVVGRRQDDPQDERPERQQAHEEGHDHGAQHEHHLPAVPERRPVGVGRHRSRIGHQVTGDDHVQYGQHEQRHHEERRYGADEKQYRPHGDSLGTAHRHQRTVHVLFPVVVG